MEIQPQCLSKVSNGFALSTTQSVISRKFHEGLASLYERVNFFSYDGCFHVSGSHVVQACGTRNLPSLMERWSRGGAMGMISREKEVWRTQEMRISHLIHRMGGQSFVGQHT